MDKTIQMKNLITNIKSLVLLVFVTATSPLFSQPFTTVWDVPSGNSTLSFFIEVVGPTTYSWTAGTQSGNGTWDTSDNGLVTINVSAPAANTPLTLSIGPDNLRQFYMGYGETSNHQLIDVTNWVQ